MAPIMRLRTHRNYRICNILCAFFDSVVCKTYYEIGTVSDKSSCSQIAKYQCLPSAFHTCWPGRTTRTYPRLSAYPLTSGLYPLIRLLWVPTAWKQLEVTEMLFVNFSKGCEGGDPPYCFGHISHQVMEA